MNGRAQSLKDKENARVAAGNIKGIESVEGRLRLVTESVDAVAPSAPPPAPENNQKPALSAVGEPSEDFCTVVSGDTLAAIAKREYGSASLYPRIVRSRSPNAAPAGHDPSGSGSADSPEGLIAKTRGRGPAGRGAGLCWVTTRVG